MVVEPDFLSNIRHSNLRHVGLPTREIEWRIIDSYRTSNNFSEKHIKTKYSRPRRIELRRNLGLTMGSPRNPSSRFQRIEINLFKSSAGLHFYKSHERGTREKRHLFACSHRYYNGPHGPSYTPTQLCCVLKKIPNFF